MSKILLLICSGVQRTPEVWSRVKVDVYLIERRQHLNISANWSRVHSRLTNLSTAGKAWLNDLRLEEYVLWSRVYVCAGTVNIVMKWSLCGIAVDPVTAQMLCVLAVHPVLMLLLLLLLVASITWSSSLMCGIYLSWGYGADAAAAVVS